MKKMQKMKKMSAEGPSFVRSSVRSFVVEPLFGLCGVAAVTPAAAADDGRARRQHGVNATPHEPKPQRSATQPRRGALGIVVKARGVGGLFLDAFLCVLS